MVLLNIGSEFIVTNFVAFFILPIVRKVLLDCVVSQVYAAVTEVERILTGGSPHVAVFVPISLDETVDAAYHYVMAEIELTLEVEQRSFDICLHDMCSKTAVWIAISLLKGCFDLLQR